MSKSISKQESKCGKFPQALLDFTRVWRNRIFDNRFVFNIQGGFKPNNKWEFGLRWTYAGGAPYTPFDVEASQALRRGIFDESRVNGERLPSYHNLNLRVDRRFVFSNSNLVAYLDIWNVYGRENVSLYLWNEVENHQQPLKPFTNMTLPVLGLEFEF